MFEEDKIASIVEFLTNKDRQTLAQRNLSAPGWFNFLHKHGSLIIPIASMLYAAAAILLVLSYFVAVPYLAGNPGLLSLGVLMIAVVGFLLYRF